MDIDIEYLKTWEGKIQTQADRITLAPRTALAATLDRPADMLPLDGGLPPLWHWLYFLPTAFQSELGPDGHAKRGGFLPPVPFPRRMWAGGRLSFRYPLRVGDVVERTSEVVSVDLKHGRSGSLVFVLVRHTIRSEAGLALTEEQDIVYREQQASDSPPVEPLKATRESVWEKRIRPDETLLFRYSALTFNSHRIHYSRNFAMNVEGYPGLVVHGPLIATQLLDLLEQKMPDAELASFSFRAVSPLFDTEDFYVCAAPAQDGKSVELWARAIDGRLAMQAQAVLAIS